MKLALLIAAIATPALAKVTKVECTGCADQGMCDLQNALYQAAIDIADLFGVNAWETCSAAETELKAGCEASSDGAAFSCEEDCFPGASMVELESGEFVSMDKLQVGDSVRVNAKEFAPVFMFSHVEKDTNVEYFQITTKTGATLSISAGHLVAANGTLRATREVEVGQTVTLADGSTDTVVSISKKVMKGLFAPQTTAGTIVVDGVEASCFTDFASPLTQKVMLYPMRMAYEIKGAEWWLGGNKNAGVPSWMRSMMLAAKEYLP